MRDRLHPARKFSPRDKDAPFASQAFQANIGAQANNPPLVTSARVWLAQSYNVFYAYIGQHHQIIPPML
jgi:hypothetical protein